MTLNERLKRLRRETGLSQEALGAQGFVSAPGWIKIENGQRQASEKLLGRLIWFLVAERYIPAKNAGPLKNELLTLKCLGSRSAFVRGMAEKYARANNLAHLLLPAPPAAKPKRGRPSHVAR